MIVTGELCGWKKFDKDNCSDILRYQEGQGRGGNIQYEIQKGKGLYNQKRDVLYE